MERGCVEEGGERNWGTVGRNEGVVSGGRGEWLPWQEEVEDGTAEAGTWAGQIPLVAQQVVAPSWLSAAEGAPLHPAVEEEPPCQSG